MGDNVHLRVVLEINNKNNMCQNSSYDRTDVLFIYERHSSKNNHFVESLLLTF